MGIVIWKDLSEDTLILLQISMEGKCIGAGSGVGNDSSLNVRGGNVKNPLVGDIVQLDGESTVIIDHIRINKRLYYALKDQDGVKEAVPSESIEWGGQQYIVNASKLD